MEKRAAHECDAGSLFTWHVPLFAVANRRAFARERRARVDAWCAGQASDSLERRVVELVTAPEAPSAALCHAALERFASAPGFSGPDQYLRAALLQRFALAAVDPSGAGGGRRARAFGPTDAYGAAAEAFSWCDAARESGGIASIPDVVVELGLTLVRTALVVGMTDEVEAPLAAVAENASRAHAEVASLAERVADDLDSTSDLRRDATVSALQSRARLLTRMREDGRDQAASREAEAMLRRIARARAAGDADETALAEFESLALADSR